MPPGHPMQATSLRFAAGARTLGSVGRSAGLVVPSFRSPPRLSGVDRTLRRRPDGGATVSVRLRGRPWVAVLTDMIDGVLATNRLPAGDAADARSALWAAAERADLVDTAPRASWAAPATREEAA
ncbi:MAG: hypothetical protein HYX32_11580 [Actinobacteria bacterium]|nr:hypothetical protein [Actinomycetota bacterium]